MKFITLTSQDGLAPVYVNPDHIMFMMSDSKCGTSLQLTPRGNNMATTLYVWEGVDEIIKTCEEKGGQE